jgi:hypothetical protein
MIARARLIWPDDNALSSSLTNELVALKFNKLVQTDITIVILLKKRQRQAKPLDQVRHGACTRWDVL